MGSFDEKNILITGATGLICSHLVNYFISNTTAKLFTVGRNKKKMEKLFGKDKESRIEFIEQDISSPLTMDVDFDFIFHAAGPIDSETIRNKPLNVIMPNIMGLLNCFELMKCAKNHNKSCRLIVFSSATLYDSPTKTEADGYSYKESDLLPPTDLKAPNSCYFESKRMSEVISYSLEKQFDADVVIARFAYVYGNSVFMPNTAFYQFLEQVLKGENIVINKPGLPRRDNIYVDDAVNGLIQLALLGKKGEVYNISSNGDKGNFAAIDEIAAIQVRVANEMTGSHAKLVCKSDVPRQPGVKLDNTKLKELGWNIQTSLEDGIRSVLQKNIWK